MEQVVQKIVRELKIESPIAALPNTKGQSEEHQIYVQKIILNLLLNDQNLAKTIASLRNSTTSSTQSTHEGDNSDKGTNELESVLHQLVEEENKSRRL